MSREQQEKTLFKNTGILAIGTVLTKCISFLIVIFYSSWLTATEYGRFELFVSYISLLIPMFSLSCGEAIFRMMLDGEDRNDHKKLVTSGLFVYLVGFVLCVCVVFGMFRATFAGYMSHFVLLYAAEAFFNFMTFVVRGTRKLGSYAIAGVINTLVMSLSATILVRFLGLGLKGLIIAYTLGYLSASLLLVVKTRVTGLISLSKASFNTVKNMLKYSVPLIPNSIAWWIASASDRTIVSINLGDSYTGTYSIAHKIPSLCVIIYNVFHLSWQENATDALKEGGDVSGYFNRIFNRILPTLLSVSIAVLSINYYMYQFVFDEKYIDGYSHVWILVAATVFSFLAQFVGGIFIALKKPSINGVTTVIAALTNVVFDLATIRYIGLYAASLSTLVAYVVFLIIRLIVIRKHFRLKLKKKNLMYCALFIYFITAQFWNTSWLRVVNVLLAVAIVIEANKEFVVMIWNGVAGSVITKLKKT